MISTKTNLSRSLPSPPERLCSKYTKIFICLCTLGFGLGIGYAIYKGLDYAFYKWRQRKVEQIGPEPKIQGIEPKPSSQPIPIPGKNRIAFSHSPGASPNPFARPLPPLGTPIRPIFITPQSSTIHSPENIFSYEE